MGPFKNLTELGEAVKSCWEGFGEETILGLVRTMPDRIKQVIANKGGAIGY